jgi:hypothetical protein
VQGQPLYYEVDWTGLDWTGTVSRAETGRRGGTVSVPVVRGRAAVAGRGRGGQEVGTPGGTVLHCVMLCYAVLHCVMLCCTVLCCVLLCCTG